MTTIAYKDGILATDTLITSNYVRKGYTTKAARCPDGRLVAACGTASYGRKLLDWARKAKGSPPMPGENEEANGLVFHPDGVIQMLEYGGTVVVTDEFYSFGSGSEFALGAMASGATSEEAIEIAIRFDTCSGGEVETHTHERKKS